MRVNFPIRDLRHRPALTFAVVAVLSLALAIVTALSSIVDGLLFRPLPFPDAGRILAVDYRRDGNRPAALQVYPWFADQREALRLAIESSPLLSGKTQAGIHTFFAPADERDAGLRVAGVDSRFFGLFGLTVAAGRPLTRDDERSPGALARESANPLPVVLGHELATRLYGGAEGALGLHDLAGRLVRIVGVTRPGVKFPNETNVWAPVPAERHFLPAYVRLAPNATPEQVAIAFPALEIRRLRDVVQPGGEQVMVALLVSATLLLVVTWVQIAALLVSGALGRIREMGVRLALGARRLHLVRAAAAQSVLSTAAALGIVLLATRPLTRFIVQRMPGELRSGRYLDPDFRVFALAGILSLAGMAILTLLPALVIGRVSPLSAIRGRLTEASWAAGRWRGVLLFGQMTATALVLYLSGLALHRFVRVTTFDYGFDSARVLLFTPPPWARGATSSREYQARFAGYERNAAATTESLIGLRGVSATGLYSGPLNTGFQDDQPVRVLSFGGRPQDNLYVRDNTVGPEFVQTLGARVLAGSGFTESRLCGTQRAPARQRDTGEAADPRRQFRWTAALDDCCRP